jgi:hypothetical protein
MANSLRFISGYRLQAQPGGLWQVRLREMQESPQAFPLEHHLQHDMALVGVDVGCSVGTAVGAIVGNSVGVGLEMGSAVGVEGKGVIVC